jgi:hypothetical protein
MPNQANISPIIPTEITMLIESFDIFLSGASDEALPDLLAGTL